MDIRFDDQVVLITGASTGIGAALARAFGAAGARVVVHYNQSQEAARAVAKDIQAQAGEIFLVQADVTSLPDLEAMVDRVMEHFGRIDILINNAGGLVQRCPIPDMSDELYHQVMDLNVTSVFQLCRLIIPIMQKQGRGNIINVSSLAARTGGGGGSVMYAASKGAVATFTRGLARELVEDNIRVNALSPGIILTPFHERYTSPEHLLRFLEAIPMKRGASAEECVGPVFFLASDEMSSYVTGQVIEVNGGQLSP